MRIAIVSPLPSYPVFNGAKQRIVTLGGFLKARGHSLHYIYFATEGMNATQYEGMKQQWDTVTFVRRRGAFERSRGEYFGVDDWCQPHLVDEVQETIGALGCDAVIVNYVFLSKVFEGIDSSVLKILDTHDRMSGRLELYKEIGEAPGFFYTTEDEEKIGLSRADIVLAIQENEARYFRDAGIEDVRIIGHLPQKSVPRPTDNEVPKVGFVGSANKFNIASLTQLIDEIGDSDVPYELHIAGSVGNRLDRTPSYVHTSGFVDDLTAFYQGLDVVVVPLVVGTGQKIKTIEAMSYGKPVVSTGIGFDGIPVRHEMHSCGDLASIVRSLNDVVLQPRLLEDVTLATQASFEEYETATMGAMEEILAAFQHDVKGNSDAGFCRLKRVWQESVDRDIEQGNSANSSDGRISELLDETISTSFAKNPLAKYRSYKALAEEYARTRGA